MRFDYSRFLLAIERRFRRLRGFSLACRFLFYGSIAGATGSLALRWLLPDLPLVFAALPLIVPISLAAGAFFLGWWRRPSVPHLLMRLDDKLDSSARISSLYELRIQGQASFFQERLETLVESISTDWKRGIALPRRTLGFLSAGVAGILFAVVIIVLPVSFPRAISSEPPVQSEPSVAQTPLSSDQPAAQDLASRTSDEATAPLELSEELEVSQMDPTQEATQSGPNEELTLDSTFDDLNELSRGQAQVDAPTTSDELLDLAEAQAQARQALSEMLKDLQQQMKSNPRPLTQQESKTMKDLASETGDPEIEEQTDDIVDEPNPDQIGEKLQDLMEELDSDASGPETSPESDEEKSDGSDQNAPQSTEVSGDEAAAQQFLERTAERLEEQANAESDQEGNTKELPSARDDKDAPESGEDGSTDVTLAGQDDDLSQTGGEDGIETDSANDAPAGEIGFIREDAPSAIGTEGEFTNEFVTKGVPVEVAPSDGRTATHIVDFDRMDSILSERGLPDEALDSIRRYFELITQPEGGS